MVTSTCSGFGSVGIWASWIRIKTLKNILKDTEGFGPDPLVRGDPRIRIRIRTKCHESRTLFTTINFQVQGLFALSLLYHKVRLGNHSITRMLNFIKNEREFSEFLKKFTLQNFYRVRIFVILAVLWSRFRNSFRIHILPIQTTANSS